MKVKMHFLGWALQGVNIFLFIQNHILFKTIPYYCFIFVPKQFDKLIKITIVVFCVMHNVLCATCDVEAT